MLGDFIPDEGHLLRLTLLPNSFLKIIWTKFYHPFRSRSQSLKTQIFEGNKQMTLEEVGKVFGVTRERIRQIEAKP